MGETKRAYINGYKEFREEIVNWSVDTIKRRIKDEGMPAIKDTNGYLFPRKELELWFKRRTEKAG